jgi:hypothetical protein
MKNGSRNAPADGPVQPAGASPVGLVAAGIDRRGFLRSAAGGGVAVAIAAMLPAGCTADYPQAEADGASLASLTAKEYAVVRAAAEALLVDVPVRPDDVAAAIDRELALVGDPVRADMKSALRLLEHFTVLAWHRRTFTELRPDERLRYLQGWATSRLVLRRGVYQALRGFVTYFAYIRPETRALTAFTGPYQERVPVVPVRSVDYGGIA